MIDPKLLDPAWLADETSATSFARGSRYARDGRARVTGTLVDSTKVLLAGSCIGSAEAPYRQEVEISTDGYGVPVLDGDCSCPVGFNCKHVVALVLTWLEQQTDASASTDRVSAWLDELRDSDTTADEARSGATPESLLYLLKLGQYPDGEAAIELAVSRQRKDGAWTKGRVVSLASVERMHYRGSYVRPIDREILDLMLVGGRDHWTQRTRLGGITGHLALQKMASTGRLYVAEDRLGPLTRGPDRELTVSWAPCEGGYKPTLDVAASIRVLLDLPTPAYIDETTLTVGDFVLAEHLTSDQLQWLLRAPVVAADRVDEVSRHLARSAPGLPTPVAVPVVDLRAPPQPCLIVDVDPSTPLRGEARLCFRYGHAGEVQLAPTDARQTLVIETDGGLLHVHRDASAERQAAPRLAASGLVEISEELFVLLDDEPGISLRHEWLDWWHREAPKLRDEGWAVEYRGKSDFGVRQASALAGAIDEGAGDWFSLRFDLQVNGQDLPMLPLVAELLEQYRPGQLPDTLYLEVEPGEFVRVDAALIAPVLETILELHNNDDKEELTLAKADAARLLDLGDLPIRGGTSLRRLANKLADWSGLRTVKLPSTFKGTLRTYQQHGVDWLQFLREYGFNGILGDDMGLGKTIQTLAHLAVERRAGRMDIPSLIVAPTSLMSNWRREAAQFTPKLKVLVLHGPQRETWFSQLAQFDVVLTTYPLLPRDRDTLLGQPWHYVILDEAQHVKNPKAQAAQVIRGLDCRHRLCLTGTPLENHLRELWTQFDFLMPGFLGDAAHFANHYATPIEKHGKRERLEALTRRVRPFLLRRTKERVASELPAKSEFLRAASFGTHQAKLYESIRLTMESRVRKAITARGLARSHIVMLDALLKLRQVCCDPRLLPANTPGAERAGSAKFELLFEILPELLEDGRRVLLFSQFTSMLGLIEEELLKRDIGYSKLTGQTRRRDEAIDSFREGEVDLFLISLKAGGVGLNLVEADTVIHYDPWWNPAAERQATDRAHRIGQHRPVFVYKLVTEGTVEEKIIALQARKQALADATYGQGVAQDEPPIDEEMIRELFRADA
ncbi:MAG: DEAD/DEAH box helicase [Pseudomonadota bacterium]